MARLEQALQLRQLAQRLAASDETAASHPALVYGALARLQKARPRLIAGLRSQWGKQTVKRWQHPKLILWKTLATPNQVSTKTSNTLLQAIQQTEAWKQSQASQQQRDARLTQQPWNHRARLDKADRLIQQLDQQLSELNGAKLFFWHHYDALGFLPSSWQLILETLRKRGWIVVVSSSGLNQASQQQLEQTGCIITKRKNLGLCLGAYRDFCCLLNEHKHLCNQVQTLALCNDSTLPIGGHEPFCNDVDSIANNLRTDSSQMEGLTDSVQTTSYHIQTYFLAINACLLQDDCWPEFWEMLNPYGDKDDLIQRGEVGLSQWLLKQGVSINARYSLASILLNQPSANSELNDLDLRQPKEVNTTLMCWKALLKAGFPLIKKQLLLDPPHFLPRAIPMSELSQHLSAKDQKLRSDLEQLMKSRFFKL